MTRRAVLAVLAVPLVGYVVWDYAESRALASDIAAIAARGEPTTAKGDPPGADTVERHDAARIYAGAAERVRAMPQELTFRLSSLDLDTLNGPPPDPVQLERTYRPDAPALQLLDQATPLDFNGFGDVEVERANAVFLTLNLLAALRVDLLSARGQGDAAAEALIANARLWRTVMTFQRAQISTRLLASLRILVRHARPGEPALDGLQRVLAELPDRDDLVREVQLRRAAFLDDVSRPRAALSTALLGRILRPWITRTNRRTLGTFNDAVAAAHQPWPDKMTAGKALREQFSAAFTGRRPSIMDALRPPFGAGWASLDLNAGGIDLAARRVALAAIAVERYRRAHGEAAPPSLGALVPAYLPAVPIDPFTGQPLVYETQPNGYVLYSVDVNQRDDRAALYGIGSRERRDTRMSAARDLGIRVRTN